MEYCVSTSPKDKIEFRFYGAGGSASGKLAIMVFAALSVLALLLIALLAIKLGATVLAFPWMARIRGP